MRNVKIPISSCFLMGIFTFCRYHLFFTGDIFDVFIIIIIIIIIIGSGTPCMPTKSTVYPSVCRITLDA